MTDWPDTEGATRNYLRTHTDVDAMVVGRVFFEVPRQATYPLIVVRRVGGFDDPSDAPIDQAVIQLSCWGSLHDESHAHPNKAEATRVRNAVRQALHDLHHQPATVTLAGDDPHDVCLFGPVIQSDPYLPDPDNRRPRYVVTAQLTAARVAA